MRGKKRVQNRRHTVADKHRETGAKRFKSEFETAMKDIRENIAGCNISWSSPGKATWPTDVPVMSKVNCDGKEMVLIRYQCKSDSNSFSSAYGGSISGSYFALLCSQL